MSTTINNTGVVATGALQLQSNGGTTAIYADTSQNVGIGTSSPTDNLQLTKAGNAFLGINCTSTGAAGVELIASGSSEFIGYANNLRFATITGLGAAGFSEKMRIDTSGNVGIGGTPTKKFELFGSNGNVQIDANGNNINFTRNGATYLTAVGVSATLTCIANSAGVILNTGATSWASASDERVKDIIEPITDAASKVSTLRAVIGKYKTDEEGKRRSFLIAQDVQAVLPEAVSEVTPDEGDAYLALSYTETIPLLVAAIQEQQVIITTQAATIESQALTLADIQAKLKAANVAGF